MNALLINCSPVRTGATQEICNIAARSIESRYEIKSVCIDDFKINFCKGCRKCHETASCFQHDDMDKIINLYKWADVIISVSPSYWADVPGQFKSFIDRCTPWCNTHEPHASIGSGKWGYSIVLRTGPSINECHRIVQSIEHFYGHMEISSKESLCLCSVENKEDVHNRVQEITSFCNNI